MPGTRTTCLRIRVHPHSLTCSQGDLAEAKVVQVHDMVLRYVPNRAKEEDLFAMLSGSANDLME